MWTNRVEVKVVDPVADPGSHLWLVYLLALLTLLAAGAYAVVVLKKKKALERERALADAALQRPIEELYLEALKEQIPLERTDLEIGVALSRLSKLVRKYWAQKFSVPGLEATTEQFLAGLKAQPIEERIVREVQEILQIADVAKFSGTGADRPTLDRLYTLYEFQLKSFKSTPIDVTGG